VKILFFGIEPLQHSPYVFAQDLVVIAAFQHGKKLAAAILARMAGDHAAHGVEVLCRVDHSPIRLMLVKAC